MSLKNPTFSDIFQRYAAFRDFFCSFLPANKQSLRNWPVFVHITGFFQIYAPNGRQYPPYGEVYEVEAELIPIGI